MSVLSVASTGWEREEVGKPTVGDDDARAAGDGLFGDSIGQIVGQEHLGLGGRLVRGLHVVEEEADVVPGPVGELLGEAVGMALAHCLFIRGERGTGTARTALACTSPPAA